MKGPSFGLGPLDALHAHIIEGKALDTPASWGAYVLAPVLPLLLSAYLLVGKNAAHTRRWRIALGVIGTLGAAHSFVSFRCTGAAMNGFNMSMSMNLQVVVFKLVEFAALSQIHDPWIPHGRNRLLAAVDLVLNSRMLFLGQVGLDPAGGTPNTELANIDKDSKKLPQVENHLRHLALPPLPRLRAAAGHLALGIAYFLLADLSLAFFRYFPALTHPGTGVRHALVASTRFTVPGTSILLPALMTDLVAKAAVAGAVIYAVGGGYHLPAAIAILLGWEPEAWDVNMIGNVWNSSSLCQLWGRNWHQIHRHQITTLAHLVTSSLPLAPLRLLLAFFFSGLMHAVACLPMHPAPSPGGILSLFVLAGLGVVAEGTFRRLTGKRVQGLLGRVWTWSFMAVVAGPAVDAWADAGVGASAGAAGPMDLVMRGLMTVFVPVHV